MYKIYELIIHMFHIDFIYYNNYMSIILNICYIHHVHRFDIL